MIGFHGSLRSGLEVLAWVLGFGLWATSPTPQRGQGVGQVEQQCIKIYRANKWHSMHFRSQEIPIFATQSVRTIFLVTRNMDLGPTLRHNHISGHNKCQSTNCTGTTPGVFGRGGFVVGGSGAVAGIVAAVGAQAPTPTPRRGVGCV